jgi:hypothetical protein
MARLQDIQQGTRAIKRVTFPLVNCPSDLVEPSPELQQAREADIASAHATAATYPTHDTIGLRVLLPGEYAAVLERALAFSRDHGDPNPNVDESPIYNLGKQIGIVAASGVDPDCPRNPDGSDRLYGGDTFEAAFKAIETSVHFNRDTLAFLCQHWESWCEHVNPQASHVDYDTIVKEGAKSADFLHLLRAGIVLNCMHSMAAELVILRELKLPSTSPSSKSTKSASKTPKKKARR